MIILLSACQVPATLFFFSSHFYAAFYVFYRKHFMNITDHFLLNRHRSYNLFSWKKVTTFFPSGRGGVTFEPISRSHEITSKPKWRSFMCKIFTITLRNNHWSFVDCHGCSIENSASLLHDSFVSWVSAYMDFIVSLCSRRSVSLVYDGIFEDLWPSLFGKQHQHNHANVDVKKMKQSSFLTKEMFWAIACKQQWS